MRRIVLSVALLATVLFSGPPAHATNSYSASLTVSPGYGGGPTPPGTVETLTYHLSSTQYSCPTPYTVRFAMDATTINNSAAVGASTCSAVVKYTVPRGIQCGQHTFAATPQSTEAPALGRFFYIQCPNTPGGILWGNPHGSPVVHQTVAFDLPKVPTTAQVRYYWKIGNTYTSMHTNRFTIPWSANGTYVYGVVRVTENSTQNYWHSYRFGPVKP